MKLLNKLFHFSNLGQAVALLTSVILVALLSRFLPTNDYAIYVMITALWAIGNAVIGTAVGTRIAKASATGSGKIRIALSEIIATVGASTVIGGYVFWSTSDYLTAVLSGIAMVSFVVSEIRIAFEIGRKRFGRYFSLLSLRTTMPLMVFITIGLIFGFDISAALSGTIIANFCSAIIFPKVWGPIEFGSIGRFGQSVGFLNLGLWVIASADRVILQRLTEPMTLAVYALLYGLLDKGFRALSNSMITRFLGDFSPSSKLVVGRNFYLITLLATLVAIPCGVFASNIISGGKYTPEWSLTALVSVALMFMLWSTPGYLAIVHRGDFSRSLLVLSVIVSINVTCNFLFIPDYGAYAAAASSLVSYLLWWLWVFYMGRRHNRVNQPVSY